SRDWSSDVCSSDLFLCAEVLVPAHIGTMDAHSQVLGHFTAFHGFHTHAFEGMAEVNQCLVVVQFAPESQAPCPGKNGSDWVRACFLALLGQQIGRAHV